MLQQQDDITVIQMILQGQQSAYAILVHKYQSYVFTLVLRYVKEREPAEELAQDVFVKAYRCLADFKGSSKFSTWLYTIVHTTCLSYLRKRKDTAILSDHEQIQSLSDKYHDTSNPGSVSEQRELKLALTRAIARLPGEDAQIITLFYLGEQSLDEIGKILGITAGNVKIKLYRARQKLRRLPETQLLNEHT